MNFLFKTDKKPKLHEISVEKVTGKYGSDEGDFKSPQTVVIDPLNDRIHVADLINSRIQVFSLGLEFLFSFPSPSSGSHFLYPYGICIVETLVFVTASSTDYLKNDLGQGLFIYTTDGVFVADFLNRIVYKEDMTLKSPQGIAADTNNTVYIADYGNDRVIELHNDLSLFKVLLYTPGPHDVKIYQSKLYVLSDDCQVKILCLEDQSFLKTIRVSLPTFQRKILTEFFEVSDIGLFISNRKSNKICFMSHEGELIKELGEDSMCSHIKGVAMINCDRMVNVCEKDSGRLKLLKLSSNKI
ncbi:hypothetical protein LOD99_4491 [Oopsacas minuta]|uniref:Uncharacterized protein n=1 Tax=Oopsacas minuta TaxID=111878 RepID=A0AAV7JUM2_9METZ|nr:hypothetical protein LOD99_4491 [Oopsacas minuta]